MLNANEQMIDPIDKNKDDMRKAILKCSNHNFSIKNHD